MSKADTPSNRLRMLWLVPPGALGIFALTSLVGSKPAPVKVKQAEVVHAVRTISVPQVNLRPMAEGYGVVQPAKVWSAVAQVSGRIIEMHPRLRDGEIIPEGTLLFRIDPVNTELALEQLKAQLLELEVQQQNTSELLEIEQRNLTLAQRESARLQELANKGTTSRSSADSAERSMLNSRSAVQNLRNTLALIPTQRRVIDAKVRQAQRDLENTRIEAPFNLRIANLTMETDQYVTTGQKLFEGDGVDRAEVIAQVAISSMAKLFTHHGKTAPNPLQMSEGLAEYADLHPVIQMDMGDHTAEWEAKFVRFTDRIDSETRTIGAVVAIDKPYKKIIPGQRPPLSKGMFVRVQLHGRVQPKQLIIPRTALRNGRVLSVDQEQRLKISELKVLYHQGEVSIIDPQSTIKAGEQLGVTDLIPAVAGMRLQPQPDTLLQQQLNAAGVTP